MRPRRSHRCAPPNDHRTDDRRSCISGADRLTVTHTETPRSRHSPKRGNPGPTTLEVNTLSQPSFRTASGRCGIQELHHGVGHDQAQDPVEPLNPRNPPRPRHWIPGSPSAPRNDGSLGDGIPPSFRMSCATPVLTSFRTAAGRSGIQARPPDGALNPDVLPCLATGFRVRLRRPGMTGRWAVGYLRHSGWAAPRPFSRHSGRPQADPESRPDLRTEH